MPNACMRSLFIAIRLKFDITNMGGKVNKGINMWCVSDQVGGLLGEKNVDHSRHIQWAYKK